MGKVKGSFGHISTCVFSTHVITIAASHPCDTLSHHQSMQRDHSTSGSACSMVCTTGMRAQCHIQAQRLPSRYLMVCSKLLCPCQYLVPPVAFFFSASGGRDPRLNHFPCEMALSLAALAFLQNAGELGIGSHNNEGSEQSMKMLRVVSGSVSPPCLPRCPPPSLLFLSLFLSLSHSLTLSLSHALTLSLSDTLTHFTYI